MPEITFKTEFYDEQAEKIKACFSPGVIKIVADDKKEGNLFILFNRVIKILISKILYLKTKLCHRTIEGRKKAIIGNPRLDMCSRQVYMHDEFKDLVDIFKIRDHFICRS